MSARSLDLKIYAFLIAVGIIGPLLVPSITSQMAVMWLMVLMAVTWDMTGGQMGYNSLGNITFFGLGMYASAVVQIGLVYDVMEYTASFGAIKVDFTVSQYWTGLVLGIGAGGAVATVFALVVGPFMLGLRGPYFAIGTLGLAVAVAELISGWRYVGGGSGISMPIFPGEAGTGSIVFYVMFFVLAIVCHMVIRAVYRTRFGLAINAIRDDEDKAEAMGIHTTRYKVMAWAISAFFMGMAGAIFGNMSGFIEPLEVAFPTATFGIFMVAMALLGGKGTLWGPVLGAILFHIVKEVTWTELLGWQWVALGAIIILNIVYFQQGILGWAQDRWPALFGVTVDEKMSRTGQAEAAE
ncbi:MAG: branched-chain amino acid ABC transporter permease [Nisaea sp.]|jgi:branched-chain amino acid transport system permease protein|uniref:branched-chain amino acid ABC transporter permease n=1 Tax=Nisaea sp. TaxID=2024842 RepID=UPI001AFDE9AA|nr:branched-chain amino acid ABC transporter permease [Nisaea sp.]MBO6559760.1 branched-chain amino acid ABC transporter permease [Nisaea sp.]